MAFSIITIAASTMAPMAMAMPPRLMMSAPSPMACMAMNASSTPTGSMMMATSAGGHAAGRRSRRRLR